MTPHTPGRTIPVRHRDRQITVGRGTTESPHARLSTLHARTRRQSPRRDPVLTWVRLHHKLVPPFENSGEQCVPVTRPPSVVATVALLRRGHRLAQTSPSLLVPHRESLDDISTRTLVRGLWYAPESFLHAEYTLWAPSTVRNVKRQST